MSEFLEEIKPNIVPVIASFDSEGHVKPLYVRIQGESMKVHSSCVKPSIGIVYEYSCLVVDGDYLKPLTLFYYQNERVWTIPDHLVGPSDFPDPP